MVYWKLKKVFGIFLHKCFRFPILFLIVLHLLSPNCRTYGQDTISKILPSRESWYNSFYNDIARAISHFESAVNCKTLDAKDKISDMSEHVGDFLSDSVIEPVEKSAKPLYEDSKDAVDQVSEALTAINKDTYIESNLLQSHPKVTGDKSFLRRVLNHFANLKRLAYDKSYQFCNYIYHLYFTGVGHIEDFILGRICQPLLKAKFPYITKKLCKSWKLVKENSTRQQEYYLPKTMSKAVGNIIEYVKKPDTKMTKDTPLEDAATRIEDIRKSHNIHPATDIAQQVRSSAKSLKDHSWNPVNRLYPSWLSKKKNEVSSAIGSEKDNVPNNNDAKDVAEVIKEPTTLYDRVKNTAKSPMDKLYPSWLSKEKENFKTAVKNIPIQAKGIPTDVTNPVKKLYENLKNPISTHPTNIFNRFVVNPLENGIFESFDSILGRFLPPYLRNSSMHKMANVFKFALFAAVAVAVGIVVLLYRCLECRRHR